MFLTYARGLRDPERVRERLELLETAPDAQPLVEWSRKVERDRGLLVPFVDPADAASAARVLVLLEAPGPMTNAANPRPGSGFISVDNDDRTAEAAWTARHAVGLEDAVHWNIVPWYLGTAAVKPRATDLERGAALLLEFMALIPGLEVVVASGRYAQVGWARHLAHERPDLHVIETWHPSPLALNRPGRTEEFTAAIARAKELS